MKIKIFLLFILLIPVFGVSLGFYYSSLPENNPQRDKKSCESVHGEWIDDENRCLISYKKAGENCVDGGQCESGICFPSDITVAQKDMVLAGKIIENMSGICHEDTEVSGCIEQVIDGTISKASMCIED